MTKGARRWVVGLLAGGALALAGCQRTEGDEKGRASETPQHQPKPRGAAEPLSAVDEHPATTGQASPGEHIAAGTPLGGGTAGPNSVMRQRGTGILSEMIADGLGTSLADAYRAPIPENGTATGGSGAAGSATSGKETKSGAGSASGGNMGGQQGRK